MGNARADFILRTKLEEAAKADMAVLFRFMEKPFSPCGAGFTLDRDSDIFFQGTHWKSLSQKTAKLGQYTHGLAIHYLAEHEGMRLEDAINTALKAMESNLLHLGSVPRMKPEERLKKKEDKDYLVEQISKFKDAPSDGEEDSKKPPKKPHIDFRTDEKNIQQMFDGLEHVWNINRSVLDYAFSHKKIKPQRGKAVFPGYNDTGDIMWYAKIGIRSTSHGLAVGPDVEDFSEWPWLIGNESSQTVCVYTDALETLSYLSYYLKADPKSLLLLMRDTHLALTTQTPVALLAYLSRNEGIQNIIFRLDNTQESADIIRAAGEVLGERYTIKDQSPLADYESWRYLLLHAPAPSVLADDLAPSIAV